MPIKVVVFDLWNTLIYDSSTDNHEKISNLLGFKDRSEFWDYCDLHFFNKNQTFYEFVKDLVKERNLPDGTFQKIESLWEESKTLVYTFPESASVLKKLKSKYKLAIVSNAAEDEANSSLEKLNIKEYFDYIVISCKVGLAKPDKRIFQLALDHFNVEPEETVMVGDNMENDIITPRMMGFKTFLIDRRKKYLQYENESWYINSLNDLESKL